MFSLNFLIVHSKFFYLQLEYYRDLSASYLKKTQLLEQFAP